MVLQAAEVLLGRDRPLLLLRSDLLELLGLRCHCKACCSYWAPSWLAAATCCWSSWTPPWSAAHFWACSAACWCAACVASCCSWHCWSACCSCWSCCRACSPHLVRASCWAWSF